MIAPTSADYAARREAVERQEARVPTDAPPVAAVPLGCEWVRGGHAVCLTRQKLYRAVVEATRLPASNLLEADERSEIVLEAIKAHKAHECELPGEGQQAELRGMSDSSMHLDACGGPASSGAVDDAATVGRACHADKVGIIVQPSCAPGSQDAHPSPITRRDLDRLLQECIGAGIAYGIRMAERGYTAESLDVGKALDRLTDAHAAFSRAMDRYRST